MNFLLLRKASFLRSITNSLILSQSRKFSTSKDSSYLGRDRGHSVNDRLHLSPMFPDVSKYDMNDCKIEVMDDAAWHVSSGLAVAWRGNNEDQRLKTSTSFSDRDNDDNGVINSVVPNKDNHDFDEIEDMRIRGNLFYKLDKDSREYEEYKFDSHGRKIVRNAKDRKRSKDNRKKENPSTTPKKKDTQPPREIKKMNKQSRKTELLLENCKDRDIIPRLYQMGDSCVAKKQRTLTFNQLTAPYHEPFCLDIYISKGSVRASIIHRATSKVVAVSHSISKDMKFDLGSTKNRSACGAVGKVLAQRALEDDIHNVVYTPRRGDKVEGKLEIVLKAIIACGVDVKVKLKQRKLRQARGVRSITEDRKLE